MENIQPTDTPDDLQKKGRLKLIGIFLVFIVMAFAFAGTGFLMRDKLRERAGNFMVDVRNKSELKLRADIIVENELVTLEMDPGEGGKVRFQKHDDGPVLLQVYNKLDKTYEVEAGDFTSETPNSISFEILSETNVLVSYTETKSNED